MDLSVAEVSTMLRCGQYIARPGRNSPSAGRYYRILRDVYENNTHQRIKRFYQCSVCGEVIKHDPSKGTKPLNKHADDCDIIMPKSEYSDNILRVFPCRMNAYTRKHFRDFIVCTRFNYSLILLFSFVENVTKLAADATADINASFSEMGIGIGPKVATKRAAASANAENVEPKSKIPKKNFKKAKRMAKWSTSMY